MNIAKLIEIHKPLLLLAELELPTPTAYKVLIILEKAQEELYRFETLKAKLIKKYKGLEDLEKGIYVFATQKQEKAYKTEFDKLLSIQIDLGTLTLAELEASKLSAFLLKALLGSLIIP